MFEELTDGEWAVIQDLFHEDPTSNKRRGRPPVEARVLVNATLWILSTSEGWYKLPGRYPSRPTCRRRYEKWQADGTLIEMLARLKHCGRNVPLRTKTNTRATRDRIRPLPPNGRLRGAFWTNPAGWRLGAGSDERVNQAKLKQ